MAVTIASTRTSLGPRLGPFVGLADLNDAISYSLQQLAIATLDPVKVADTDLLALNQYRLPQFYDVALFRAWETILVNCTDELLSRIGVRESAKDVYPRIEREVARLRDYVKQAYGIGLPTLSGGVIELDFQSQNDDIPDPAF